MPIHTPAKRRTKTRKETIEGAKKEGLKKVLKTLSMVPNEKRKGGSMRKPSLLKKPTPKKKPK